MFWLTPSVRYVYLASAASSAELSAASGTVAPRVAVTFATEIQPPHLSL